ncbi:MAG: TlpA family protein disulfide reductase [Armatimonadetes bacterium]|nr:TlpA family protein disulfide reductase [Armatimonadota bacterium]
MEAVYKKYKDQGLKVVAIGGEPPEVLKKFAEAKGLTFTVLTDPTGEVFTLYNAESIPTNYFLDEQLRAVDATVGFDPSAPDLLDKMAKELLNDAKKA